MPADDFDSLASLLPRCIAALTAAQQELDAVATADEQRSGARFHPTSIPSAELRLEFGLSVSKKHGFLVTHRTTSALRHALSVTARAVPEPMAAPAGGWTRSPFHVFEPAFMIDPAREIELGIAVCDALSSDACTIKLPEPRKLGAKAMRKAGETLRGQLVRSEHPELGVVAFRVGTSPDIDLVVIVTEKAKRDGVFLVEAGAAPVLYSIPDDGNDAMFYEPLHRLTMAMGEWLSGGVARRRTGVMRLPQEWGFTTLEVFADALVSGYQRCVDLLSETEAPDAVAQQFDLARVRAEVAFAIRQGTAPSITLLQDSEPSGELIAGQVLLELERVATAIAVTLTLVAPGYVLGAVARRAFVERAQRAADRIADEFGDDRAVDYILAIKRPSNPAQIVVLLSTDDADDPFTYLVTWPVRTADGERHFVFRCREDGDSLGDVEAILRVSDRLGAVSIASAGDPSQIDADVYEAYSRFFRAARVWRSGVARDAQQARLERG